VKQLIESAGATVLYLPPYSPDLNPIELAFAKLQQLMRSAAHRTIDALWTDVQRMLDCISDSVAAGFSITADTRYRRSRDALDLWCVRSQAKQTLRIF
jgi:transposase